MTELRWLDPSEGPQGLPHPEHALKEPNGLLAAGGALAPDWLLTSYRRGIFPWYEHGQPILWWSPDPRAVLEPRSLRISRSLRRRLNRDDFEVTADRGFAAVIDACAAPRRYTESTWITDAMRHAFVELHELGWAHSFEAWQQRQLVGGLYGIVIGKVFFGESMFARETDASKVAFCHAIRFLSTCGIELIDCQLPSRHLTSLGASSLPRSAFLARLTRLTEPPGSPRSYAASFDAFRSRRPPQKGENST